MVYIINNDKMTKQILEKLEKIEAILKEQTRQPMTLEEASKFLNFSKSTLYKMTCQNRLPYYRPNGKRIYFKKSELEAWIFKHRIKTDEEMEKEADEYVKKHPIKYNIK